MEAKKSFASLMESSSSSSSTRTSLTALRPPLSPFRPGRLMGSKSRTSSQSTLSHAITSDPNQQTLSCVSKETIQDDCARQRFIVWAAVKRNSCLRMPPEKKLQCPMLRCEQQFGDHESMLTHLARCDQLPLGEYWCYDHMKVERFDDVRCKRCSNHPSKRRKVLSIAKSFFHSLGHKSRKGQGSEQDIGESSMLQSPILPLSPPPYEEMPLLDPVPVREDASELGTTGEILEIDSREIVPDVAIDPKALLIPPLPELDSSVLHSDMSMSWLTGFESPMNLSPLQDVEVRSLVSKPTLQVNTNGLQGYRAAPRSAPRLVRVANVPASKGLSPSSSVRSNASTDSNTSATSNTSSQISPTSAWSWSGTSGFDTSLTSPVDLPSPIDFMTENPLADPANACGDPCEEFLHGFAIELPADPAASTAPDLIMPADFPVISINSSTSASFITATNPTLAESSAKEVGVDEPQVGVLPDSCCSEIKSFLESAYDTLEAHISSSREKIQSLSENSLASQLRAMTTRTIAKTALETLKSTLGGSRTHSGIGVLSFTHLIYALSLVLRGESAPLHTSKDMFLQALSYSSSLSSVERAEYASLVSNIWQPSDVLQDEIDMCLATPPRDVSVGRTSSVRGKQPESFGSSRPIQTSDSLLVMAQNFLDELEIMILLGQGQSPHETLGSDLFARHAIDCSTNASTSGAFHTAASFVRPTLLEYFPDARGLAQQLNEVHQRTLNGTICSARRLEIELMRAGKFCMSTTRFLDNFAPTVRSLCRDMYYQEASGVSRRDAYYALDIEMMGRFMLGPDSANHDYAQRYLDSFIDTTYVGPNDESAMSTSFSGMDLDPCLPYDVPDTTNNEMLSGLLMGTAPTSFFSSSDGPAHYLRTGTGFTTRVDDPAPEQGRLPEQQGSSQKTEAELGCEFCGYRPKGDPQWFKGSMAKHKRLKHGSEPPKIYRCPYPGCQSAFKNRADNLRQHQIEKNHWVAGEEGASRRPSKRKKIASDDDA